MKQLLVILFLIGINVPVAWAQTEEELEKDTEMAQNKRDLDKIDSRDRLIFEFVHTNWFDKPDSLKVKWYNRGINAYLMYDMPIYDDNISFAPGIGISNANVYHRSQMIEGDTTTYFVPINEDQINVGRSKLATTYLEVPLELRFRTNPNKVNRRFKFALGLRVGYMLDGHTVYKGDPLDGSGGDEVFFKIKNVPNINRFRYGTSVRLGYGNINLVAYYSFATLFQTDKGPGMRPFSIGISFNSF